MPVYRGGYYRHDDVQWEIWNDSEAYYNGDKPDVILDRPDPENLPKHVINRWRAMKRRG